MIRPILSLLLSVTLSTAVFAGTETVHIPSSDITGGYYVKKIWLESYQLPVVQVVTPVYQPVTALPGNVPVAAVTAYHMVLGKERKRPFVLLQVPVYNMVNGKYGRLTDFTLDVTEQSVATTETAQRTTGSNSVLASGSWYKIGITKRGLCKVDFDFIRNKLGVDPAGINPGNIRLYGNGGTMLPENNAVNRPSDLTENAISVNDGGDGSFGQGDYFLFYANGPMTWEADAANKRFIHHNNLYEDTCYYFISFDQGAGRRVASVQATQAGNVAVGYFDDYVVHDDDLLNIGGIGKVWWGEKFFSLSGQASSKNISVPLAGYSDSVRLRVHFAGVSNVGDNIFSLSLNGQFVDNYNCSSINPALPCCYYTESYKDHALPLNAASAGFSISFQPGASNAEGYLDYLELNYRRQLSFANGQTFFRDWRSVGTGNIATYQLSNAGNNVQVWDVTDPLVPAKMNGTLNNGTYSFSRDAATLHEFAAFDGSQYNAPAFIGKINNQDLHGLDQTDYIIITYPDFMDAANKLADFHRRRDNFRVTIANTTQIYNEFGSGSKDPVAIRDFIRMFYDRAGTDSTQMPRYVLLLGDASYDYKNRLPGNTNLVPTFQSSQSGSIDDSYTGDDFFAFLDDNENVENYGIANTLDVGLGRLPVQKATEANALADKIIYYKSPATLGPWRISDMYVADNEDGAGEHLQNGDDMAVTIEKITPVYNHTKVYLDNMNFVSTPGGDRCPDANKAIDDQVFRGAFFMNYTGHGNIATLAHERILTSDDFNAWKNKNKLPFMVTATCDFSRFDDPEHTSSGEKLVLKNDGGAIAMLTTTEAVYANYNYTMNQSFLKAQFTAVNGKWHSFGDAFRIGKNTTYVSSTYAPELINFRKFTLLGDPALMPDFPEYAVHTDTIKNTTDGTVADTVKALGEYTIDGSVIDNNGHLLHDFNGRLYVTIYDKPRTVTLQTKVYASRTRTYQVQNNIVYRGKATVTNGRFSFSFIVPKDINYDFGKGKISYYVENGTTDGAGADSNIIVGGFTDNPRTDNDGPIVKPYMNDSLFRDGGITGNNSVLFVSLSDQSGINVSGNSVGHDLTAVLDGNVEVPYVLNDYYETAPNDYKRGYVTFPVTGLTNGEHYFTVKAWDVYNNSGEGTVHFVVVDGNVVKVDNLINYPNPFSDITHFVFEHNHPNETLKVQLRIYNLSGSLVRSLDQDFAPTGSRSQEITWDGTDNNGAKLPSAMYVYRLSLITAKGIQTFASQKVILKNR